MLRALSSAEQRRAAIGRAALAIAVAAASGCQLVLSLGDKIYTEPAEGGSAVAREGGASEDGPSVVIVEGGVDEAGPLTCPNGTKAPALVLVGGAACVDATEVTQAQYEVFLAAKSGGIDVSGQPQACSWNTTFKPGPGCEPDAGAYACGTTCGSFPQGCIDWCDAFAYCAWAGKRLCGSPAGGPASLSSITDPALSQWTAACTSGGKHVFPYGDSYVASSCVTFTNRVKAAGTFPDCQSKEDGYKGVLDLSGNVAEWEDACISSAGSTDRCRVRGGDYGGEDDFVRCDRNITAQRDFQSPDIGFRCCAP